ncbi:MarR family transcriptional regulator [Sphingobium sufflavum]|uniref:MarR family transcriptional regulator n=1 Tax=Sphingobium sufflavum TaxID=1129547 RepID=UPI001F1D2684|nr:MarR family transcriptional regulator [Sphingobium sufflavum]MCE7795428.1 MarR family transcriptional regulator [Sphingobium sufflavum]
MGGNWVSDSRPSLLIVAPHVDQRESAAMASGAGFRVIATIALDELAQRLAQTVGVDALLVDLRGLERDDARLTGLLTTLLAWPAWSDARPLMLVDLHAAETVAAMLHLPFERLLCEPALSDIGLALCMLAREGVPPAVLHDIGRESDTARLEELSAEVRRLAQTIDRLTRDDQGDGGPRLRDMEADYAPPAAGGKAGERSRKGSAGGTTATRSEIRTLLQVRRMRDRFLPGELFADPAWDMMLDLMGARLDGKAVSVSSLCIAAAVPPTTALRWISQLTERGIFQRRNDPADARRVFISLSDEAAERLTGWFVAVRQAGLRFTG